LTQFTAVRAFEHPVLTFLLKAGFTRTFSQASLLLLLIPFDWDDVLPCWIALWFHSFTLLALPVMEKLPIVQLFYQQRKHLLIKPLIARLIC